MTASHTRSQHKNDDALLDKVTDELLSHGEFSSGANNRSNAREAARAVINIVASQVIDECVAQAPLRALRASGNKDWQAICDSYAEENQRLSDQLAKSCDDGRFEDMDWVCPRAAKAEAIRASGDVRAAVIDPDLVQRCQELLQWSKTGLLAGGNGGAVRAFALKLEDTIGAHYSLNVAESQTKDDAMREVVRLAAALSQSPATDAAGGPVPEADVALAIYESDPENTGFEPNVGHPCYVADYVFPARAILRKFDVRLRELGDQHD